MIALCNVDKNISLRLSNFLNVEEFYTTGDFPHYDGIIIDWIYKSNQKEWTKQAALIDFYTKKKIPIVIFDRYFSMTRKEFDWLKRFKVFFFEPAINNRRGFAYLPQWITRPDDKWYSRDKEERIFDIGYKCNNLNNKIKSFENYYLRYAKMYPDKKVVYSTRSLDTVKEKEYREYDVKNINNFSYKQSTFTIVIDTQKNYDIGYLDENVFDALDNNCLPLLPIEHKYFNALFQGLVISVWSDLNYFVDMYGSVKEVIIEEIYDRFEKYYPEFMIDNAVEVIKNCFIR